MIWKQIKDFPSYEVSDTGMVRHIKTKSEKIFYSHNKYLIASLYEKKAKKKLKRFVHVLVFEAFVREKNSNEEIHHIDKNRSNNSLENLEILETKFHRQHHFNEGRKIFANQSLTKEKVLDIKSSSLSRKELAEKYGVSYYCIYSVLKRITWQWL
jgi:hypothetical protein